MIDKQFIVNLKGRDYPTYPGVLDAATKAGLRQLTTTVIQLPSAENGHMAVVMARAEFEEGRVFEDVGDCSPGNCSPQIASAALRMASTRGKGRVLRDSINCGMTKLEELPDDELERPQNGHSRPAQRARHDPQDHAEQKAAAEAGGGVCEQCGSDVPAPVATAARKSWGTVLCMTHSRERREQEKQQPAQVQGA